MMHSYLVTFFKNHKLVHSEVMSGEGIVHLRIRFYRKYPKYELKKLNDKSKTIFLEIST